MKTKLTAAERDEYLTPIKIETGINIESALDLVNEHFSWRKDDVRVITEKEENFLKAFVAGEIPQEVPPSINEYSEDFSGNVFHSVAQKAGYYAKITKEVARWIAKSLPEDSVILDPLAGRGFFAKALREQGVPVIASDDKSWKSKTSEDDQVKNLEAVESLKEHLGKYTHVVISWAPGSDVDVSILRFIRENCPDVSIFHIGENDGGCTGSDSFLEELSESYSYHYDDFGYMTVFGLRDRLSLWHPDL